MPTSFKPFTDKDGIWLSKLYKEKSAKFTYTFDPDILKFEKNDYKVSLIFKTDPQEQVHIYTPGLKLTSGKRPVPGLIWKYTGSLNIWAYKEFKGEETELFKAPFMNTSLEVCIGSSKIHTDSNGHFNVNQAKEKVVKGFFESAFSHVSGEPIKGNLHTLSEELLTMKSFPLSVLLPVNNTTTNKQKLLKDIL
jgi:hypothetical protein